MPKLPILKPRRFVRFLKKLGFEEVRQKGSHLFFYRSKDNKGTVIPMHRKDIGRGLTRQILKEIDISPDEFIELLKK